MNNIHTKQDNQTWEKHNVKTENRKQVKQIHDRTTNKDITIHGNGKQSRDLTYVTDAVDAFLLVAKKKQCLRSFQIINH